MASPSTRLAIPAIVIVLVTLVAAPASATHSSAHATDQIEQLATQGMQDMDAVVVAFEDDIALMDTASQVEVAEAEADDQVDAIWSAAKNAIQDLVKLYPGELGSVGAGAKQQILAKRNEGRTAISNLAANWSPTITTTTTTSPTTTTTTTSATTTTVRQPTTTTTANTTTTSIDDAVIPPRSDDNSGNGSSTGTTNGQGGQSSGALDDPNSVGTGGNQTDTDPLGSNDLIIMAQIPAQAEFAGNTQQQDEAGITSRVSGMLETVLPPAIVDLVLSPLLILEILLRTSLADGQRILVPLSLLAFCALLISLTDRHSRRRQGIQA